MSAAVEIGRGPLGAVHLTRLANGGQEVAIKVFHADVDPQALDRLVAQWQVVARLSKHPNVARVLGVDRSSNGSRYVVTEYLPGGSLADHLHTAGPLAGEAALALGVELAGALESAHRNGVLHRNVKPSNIIANAEGWYHLVDFGLAPRPGLGTGRAGSGRASTHQAPEVLIGREPDVRSEVYSLASSIHEAVGGIPLGAHSDPVVEALLAELAEAMTDQPDHRPPTAAEFGAALLDLQSRFGFKRTAFRLAPAQPTTPAPTPPPTLVAPGSGPPAQRHPASQRHSASQPQPAALPQPDGRAPGQDGVPATGGELVPVGHGPDLLPPVESARSAPISLGRPAPTASPSASAPAAASPAPPSAAFPVPPSAVSPVPSSGPPARGPGPPTERRDATRPGADRRNLAPSPLDDRSGGDTRPRRTTRTGAIGDRPAVAAAPGADSPFPGGPLVAALVVVVLVGGTVVSSLVWGEPDGATPGEPTSSPAETFSSDQDLEPDP
jgi:serine/threonine protein kinase